jgi:hypothetical protein
MIYLLVAQKELLTEIFRIYHVDMTAITFRQSDMAAIVNILIDILEKNMDNEELLTLLQERGWSSYVDQSSRFVKNSPRENLRYLYSLVLERNMVTLEIEIKELALRNNNEERRKVLMQELEVLQQKKNDLDNGR